MEPEAHRRHYLYRPRKTDVPSTPVPRALSIQKSGRTLQLGRRLILLCLLGLHTATSLCGPGHHAFDDLVERVVAGGDVDSTADECADEELRSDQDCPACHFFSLAAASVEPAPDAFHLLARPAVVRAEVTRPFASRPDSSIPRAPPHASV